MICHGQEYGTKNSLSPTHALSLKAAHHTVHRRKEIRENSTNCKFCFNDSPSLPSLPPSPPHLSQPLKAGLPVEREDRVLCKALPDQEGVGEAQPQAAVPQDEPDEVHSALDLLEVVEAVVHTVGLRVEGLIACEQGGKGEEGKNMGRNSMCM